MPDYRGTLREVAWHEIFPWLLLVRTLQLSIDVRKLLLAAAGILATGLGWWLITLMFTVRTPDEPAPPFAAFLPTSRMVVAPPPTTADLSIPWQESRDAFVANWLWISGPFRSLLSRSVSLAMLAAALLSALWALAVWAFVAGAITRIAAVELGLEERHSLQAALGHAVAKWRSYFSAPLMPLVLVLLLVLPLAVVGLLMRAFDGGVLLSALVWPLVLVAGVLMAVVVVGLALGWPLMFATISVDATDSFDAVSRSYSYTYQRPLHYLFYAAVSLLLGMIGWILAATFAGLVLWLSHWGVSWGSGHQRLAQVEVAAAATPVQPGAPTGSLRYLDEAVQGAAASELSSAGRFGAWLIGLWDDCIRLLAVAFGHSFFWTAMTAIYLLLRRDADATEIDEVFIAGREDDRSLPPLKTDPAGVSVLADENMPGAVPPSDRDASAPDKPTPSSRDPEEQTP